MLSVMIRPKGKVEEEKERRHFVAQERVAPHDFTAPNLFDPGQKPRPKDPLLGPRKNEAVKSDPFVLSGTSPLDHAYNPHISLAFVNRLGRIKSRAETGLTWKSQRAMAKLVKRARLLGIISYWHDGIADGGYGVGEGK